MIAFALVVESRRIAIRNCWRIGLIFGLVGVVCAAGCNRLPYDIAPVSGVVTLDGKLVPDAQVRFEPRGNGESTTVGVGSVGRTDSSGRYALRTHKGDRGAVVGNHMVRISTYQSRSIGEGEQLETITEEVVPEGYNRRSKLMFEVPEDGTDEANFDLTSSGD